MPTLSLTTTSSSAWQADDDEIWMRRNSGPSFLDRADPFVVVVVVCKTDVVDSETPVSHSPPSPEEMDWSTHYPEHFGPPAAASASAGSSSLTNKQVEWVDIGCGFGGLVCALAPMYPEALMLGESG